VQKQSCIMYDLFIPRIADRSPKVYSQCSLVSELLESHKDVMDDAQKEKISRCLDLNVFFLKVSAAWPGDISASRWKNSLYKCYKIILGSMVTICVLGMIMYCFIAYDSLEYAIENVIVMFQIFNLAGRAFSLNVRDKELHSLIESLPKNFFIHASYNVNAKQIASTVSTINYVRKITVSTAVLYTLTSSAMALHPLLIRSEESHGSNRSYSAQTSLPFKTWYPYITEGTSYYELQYACQTVSAAFVGIFDAAMDTLSITLLVYFALQFQLLNDSLRNMSENVILKLKTDTSDRSCSPESLQDSAKKIRSVQRPTSIKGDRPSRDEKGLLQQKMCADREDTESFNQIVLEDSAQQSIDAEMLRCLKCCIRHHQSLLE